jgi:broad specificity phosphatase PhoE
MPVIARALFLLALAFAAGAHADDALWDKVRAGGYVLMIRHAATDPGVGDPPGFKLEDCATQRNLNAPGREQARRLGERLRKERVPIAKVYTSPWCRCRETATLAFGKAEDWEALSNIFDQRDREADRSQRVSKRVGGYADRKPGGNVVMMTHGINISALTKISPAFAGIVVLRPDGCCGFKVAGTLDIE